MLGVLVTLTVTPRGSASKPHTPTEFDCSVTSYLVSTSPQPVGVEWAIDSQVFNTLPVKSFNLGHHSFLDLAMQPFAWALNRANP